MGFFSFVSLKSEGVIVQNSYVIKCMHMAMCMHARRKRCAASEAYHVGAELSPSLLFNVCGLLLFYYY